MKNKTFKVHGTLKTLYLWFFRENYIKLKVVFPTTRRRCSLSEHTLILIFLPHVVNVVVLTSF